MDRCVGMVRQNPLSGIDRLTHRGSRAKSNDFNWIQEAD